MTSPFTGRPAARLPRVLAAFAAALAIGAAAAADAYPTRPLTLVVPFPAGGTTDIMGRALGQALGKQLGQSVVVDNKAGAGGTVGASAVLRAPADGYTLLTGTPAEQVNAAFLMAKPPFDPAREFEPIGCVARYPNVLVVHGKLPVQSVADLVRYAKAEPGRLNYGSAGNGNTSHLSGELFAQAAGVEATHVPYRGNAPAITDTISGQVQMMFSSPASVAQHIKTGALRAIAVTSGARIAELPNVPTLRESGLPVEIYSWGCAFVAAKTPPEIVERLHTAMNAALNDAAMLKFIEATGGEKFQVSREEAKRFLVGERETWGKLIRARNIRAD